MTGSCLCGAVKLSIETKPDFIHDCNCTLCRKTGGAWGYFPSTQINTTGETVSVMRTDKIEPGAEVHSCKSCGSTSHFTIAKSFTDKHGPSDLVGVNMRLFDPKDIKGVEVRFPNGQDWSGQGEFEYRRNSLTVGGGIDW